MTHSRDGEGGATLLALGLSILIGLYLALLMPAHMLWDADEGYYARTAAEMVQSGNWLVPTYNGEIFAHKPPLSYWLMAVGIQVFGATEFAVRFFSAPAMAASAFLTFLIGRRLFDARVGLWAMLVLSTSLLGTYLGFSAMLDAELLLFVCLPLWAYVEMTWKPRRMVLMVAIFGLGLYLALLTKGPVGPAVVISTVAVSWLLLPAAQRLPFGHGLALAGASVVAFAAFLGWAIPADRASGGQLLSEGIGTHVIGRALEPMEGHGGSGPAGYLLTLPAYIPFLLLGFFPWIIHLPAALHAMIAGTLGNRRERVFLWSWMLPTFVMFTLAATKLPHYVFPLYPALAVAVAALIVRQSDAGSHGLLWLRIGGWLYFAGGTATALAFMAAPFLFPDHLGWMGAVPLGLGLFAAVAAVTRLQVTGRMNDASRLLALATPVAYLALVWVVVPPLEPAIKAARPMAAVVAETAGPETSIFTQGYSEPSFLYYLGHPVDRPVRGVAEDEDGLATVLAEPGDVVLVTTEAMLEAAQANAEERPFEVVGRFEAHNINRGGRLQRLVVAHRSAARP